MSSLIQDLDNAFCEYVIDQDLKKLRAKVIEITEGLYRLQNAPSH